MMPWLCRGVSYCCQVASRVTSRTVQHAQCKQVLVNGSTSQFPLTSAVRLMSVVPPRKFQASSPKTPSPNRHGYQQTFYDGGRLPRGLAKEFPKKSLKPYRPRDCWSKKKALFGQNDYIDILGDTTLRPVDLINAPRWIKGFSGNELQRLVRRLNFEGTKISQLYPTLYHQMWKRVKFLYKKYNQRRGRLPRGLAKEFPKKSLKPYRPRDCWSKKKALFGQNDYIDILGDTTLRPVDLINAPRWIKGFSGNELQRLVRRLNFEGTKISQLYPTLYHQMWKRVKFLYKKYNQRRGRRIT